MSNKNEPCIFQEGRNALWNAERDSTVYPEPSEKIQLAT